MGQHNMRAFSCEMGVAQMLGARCHWRLAGTLVLALSTLAATPSRGQEAKLVADCAAPRRSAEAPSGSRPAVTATGSCEVRFTDAVAIAGVKAAVKGRSEPLDADFRAFDTSSNTLVALILIQTLD